MGMLTDLGIILTWWIYLLGLGLIFFPLTRRIFHHFFDQGYLFAKVIGILISSYLVWILASLRILPFYRETIWLILILGVVLNLRLLTKDKSEKKSLTKPAHNPPNLLLAEELIFLITLIFWSFIRGFQPDIQGLEKFMDYGFVNSILRSKYFPPADMWFAGKSINYYYYGHYLAAFLTKLTNIPSASTYNLMIATIFAFCFSLTFSLTANLIVFWKNSVSQLANLKKPITTEGLKSVFWGGLIAAFLISLGANLHPAYYNFKMKILKKPYCNGSFNYWYPDATRYIGYCPDVEDKNIHEFPSYSFVVADLHGHVSDIPFVLSFLALSFILLAALRKKEEFSINFFLRNFLIPFHLAIMFMTNQWDLPIYLMVLGLVLLFGLYPYYKDLQKASIRAATYGVIFCLMAIPLILPFQLGFEPITKGIALVNARSLPHQLLILWGAPWFFGVTFGLFLFRTRIKTGFKKEVFIKWFSKILGVKITLKKPRFLSGVSQENLAITDIFILIFFIASTILVIIPEIIYVKDIYIPSYHRANTMFKLTYQSFMMFSILIGYVYIRVVTSLSKSFPRSLLKFVYVSLILALMIYPAYAIKGYYGTLDAKNYKGLYGLKFLERLYPDDYQAVKWLNNQVVGQPVILEAVGDSYTDYERISMATGLPTVEGWLVHEWLWRRFYDEPGKDGPGKRNAEIQKVYEDGDLNFTKNILTQYKVKYVVVGEMERKKYPNLDENKLQSLGKIVFQEGTTKIYQLN
jgi:YYY domain-containing protein